MKFLRATIETLPYGLSDELLKTTPIKSIKSEKFEINLKKRSIPIFASFCSDISNDFPAFHYFAYAQMTRNIANTELIYCFFVTLQSSSWLFFKFRDSMKLESALCRSFLACTVCRFRTFFTHKSCFRSFLVHCRPFQVISCSCKLFQVVSCKL